MGDPDEALKCIQEFAYLGAETIHDGWEVNLCVREIRSALEKQRVPEGMIPVSESFIKAALMVTFYARTSGGTAGRDKELCAALDEFEKELGPVLKLTVAPEANDG